MRNKSAILLAAIALAAFAACADPLAGGLGLYCPEDHFLFRTIDNGTAVEITGYVGGRTNVRIPPYIRGLPVTMIGELALTGFDWDDIYGWVPGRYIVAVTIPSDVTHIGYMAFAGNRLTSLVIPDSVTYIGEGAFGDNMLASTIIGSNVVSVGHWAFAFNQLTNVIIPDGITDIGIWAFAENRLDSITIGDNVIIEPAFVTGVLYDRFGESFAPFFKSQGHMAGTYTYSNGTWVFQPR